MAETVELAVYEAAASYEAAVSNEARVKKAVQSGIPLTVTTYTLPREVENQVEQLITLFLRLAGREKLKNYILYCVQELMGNAEKANTKRVYFLEKGFDISNPDDYDKGMSSFKENTLNNIAHYLELQKEKGLYIKLILQIQNNIVDIEVRNNAALNEIELVRIQEKFVRSRKYSSLEEAISGVLDDSEGAGLGLVIIILMLKKIGLGEECFGISMNGPETAARIRIPLEKTRIENFSALSAAIVESVNSLPKFPENILHVQKLINDPKSELTDIARQISMDPALTADLIKLVNSAQYMASKKVESISDAVKMVGMRGIKNLLYSYGTQKILGDDSQSKKTLWEHSYKAAFYAHTIARKFCKSRNLPEDAYVGGILHDMGKIIFSNVHPEFLDRIKSFCAGKKFLSAAFEDIAAGMNHAEIGALIAEKWNFPDDLTAAIRFHHDPVSAPKEYSDLANVVYLSNMLCELEDGNAGCDQIDSGVLENFNIASQKQIEELLTQLSREFMEINEKGK